MDELLDELDNEVELESPVGKLGGNNYLKSSTNIDLKGLSYGNSPGM